MREKIDKRVTEFKDKRKDRQLDKTRVHDKERAVDMADAQKPFLDKAELQESVGRVLGSVASDRRQSQQADPGVKQKRITPAEISSRMGEGVDEAVVAGVLKGGIKDRTAQLYDIKHGWNLDSGATEQDIQEVARMDPYALSADEAEKISRGLTDLSPVWTSRAGEEAARRASDLYKASKLPPVDNAA